MNKKLNTAGSLLFILYILAAMFLAGVIAMLDILPGKYICMFAGVLAVVTIILGILDTRRRTKKGPKIFGIILTLIITVVFVVGGFYLIQTGSFFKKISDNGKDVVEYAVIVQEESSMQELKDLDGKTIYISTNLDTEYINAQNKLKEDAEAAEIGISYEYATDMDVLKAGLLDGTSEAIFMHKGTYEIYCDENSDYADKTRILYTVSVEKLSKASAKSVDVTQDCYNVYITGLDTTGTIDVESRSDVNMVVSINPKSKQILLTSIPRDYYVLLHSAQSMDKLTHTGIYGADETVATVEDLLGCDINYYFKCNFSTVVALIDAIGGIDVISDFSFITHGRQNTGFSFVQGENHLDGASALAFARERKSFSGGDRQRIKNQQTVLAATFKKVTSSKTLMKSYGSILSSVSDYMETSFTDEEIKDLAKMQLSDMADWNIVKISLDGQGGSQPCYSVGNAYASVILQDQTSIDAAKAAIARVFAGEEITEESLTQTEEAGQE